MATAYDPLGGYATDPGPQPGSGAYGAVPGAIQIPPNIYQQIGDINPQLGAQTGTANTTILNELQGQLSPETISSLQQNAAQFGAKNGMPGSQFAGKYGQMQLGQSVEKQQQQGLSDYLKMLQGTGATLTPQQLAAQIASSNATMAAAPNPTAAANQQMQDWQNKFNAAAGGGGGVRAPNPGGGGGSPMGGQPMGGGNFAGGGANMNPVLPSGQPDYTQPFNYNSPSGSTLDWTGQDWTNLFGDPYAGNTTSQSGYLNDPSFNATQSANNYDTYYNGGAGVQNWGSLSDPTAGFDMSGYPANTYYNPVSNTSNYQSPVADPWGVNSGYPDPNAGYADPSAGSYDTSGNTYGMDSSWYAP